MRRMGDQAAPEQEEQVVEAAERVSESTTTATLMTLWHLHHRDGSPVRSSFLRVAVLNKISNGFGKWEKINIPHNLFLHPYLNSASTSPRGPVLVVTEQRVRGGCKESCVCVC